MIKKYFVLLPIMASCNGLGNKSDMFPNKVEVQSNKLNNVTTLKNLIQKRKDLYPLHDAAKNGNIENVIMLLGKGLDVNRLDDIGHSASFYAVNGGHAGVCKILFKHSANINEKDIIQKSLLHWAAYKGHIEIVKLLLEHGAEVDPKDSSGKTPIYWAMLSGHIEIIKLLLGHEVKLDEADEDGRTPLHYVSRVANKNIPEAFIAKDASKKDIAKLLIDKGFSKKAEDKSGFTPFMLAIYDEDLYEILLPDGSLKKPEDPNWSCSICIGSIEDLDKGKFPYVTLNCNHTFHLTCITKNLSTQVLNQQQINCPNCRTTISKSIQHLMLNMLIPKHKLPNLPKDHHLLQMIKCD